MRLITPENLDALAHHRGELCLSVYMPTRKAGRDTRENPIRLKNLIGEATEQLVSAGMSEGNADRRLEPLRTLLHDTGFWRNQSEGLAVFLDGAGKADTYHVPFPVEQLVSVGDHFTIKPLLPLISHGARFYLLALGQASVRLFEVTQYAVHELDVPDAPSNFAEAMRFDNPEEELQLHSLGTGGESGHAAVFHGQGTASDATQEKRRLAEFVHRVDKGVSKRLARHKEPLVLAATEPLLGLYREANSYRFLHERMLQGNPERLKSQELHDRSVELLAPLFDECVEQAVSRYKTHAGGDLAGHKLSEIVPAAHDGRIEVLLVSTEDHRWGTWNGDRRNVAEHDDRQPGDQDLLDLAAVQAYNHGGEVYAVERRNIPDGAVAAATFRYPL